MMRACSHGCVLMALKRRRYLELLELARLYLRTCGHAFSLFVYVICVRGRDVRPRTHLKRGSIHPIGISETARQSRHNVQPHDKIYRLRGCPQRAETGRQIGHLRRKLIGRINLVGSNIDPIELPVVTADPDCIVGYCKRAPNVRHQREANARVRINSNHSLRG